MHETEETLEGELLLGLDSLDELKLEGLLLVLMHEAEEALDRELLLEELEELEELWLLTLDWLELDGLETLLTEELLRSSIERMERRPSEGPGNWSSPVWKLSVSVSETSPVVRVSVNSA
jgi:hypothetical protein